MKTKILFGLLVFSLTVFGQQESLKTAVFSLTPRTKNVDKVNGLSLGMGFSISQKSSIKEINGLNVEVNPLSLIIVLFDDPSRRGFSTSSTLSINGLSIGSGHSNQNDEVAYTGLEIAMFNTGFACNGISINGFYNYSVKLNGIHFSGIATISKTANGLFIAVNNNSETMNGLQLGLINKSIHFNGLQLGIFNKSKSQKGLQVGFWNINNKRSMPFINW
jgi:hypothetical protein